MKENKTHTGGKKAKDGNESTKVLTDGKKQTGGGTKSKPKNYETEGGKCEKTASKRGHTEKK